MISVVRAETGHPWHCDRAGGMIRLKSVSHTYGGRTLLDGVDLHLAPGSFHFLTGPSGTGKTTFLRLCYGELRATTGTVKLFGDDLSQLGRDGLADARQRIGVIHQDCQFLDHLSVAQNLALPFAATNRPVPDQNLRDLLAWVGLQDVAEARPPTLSGGERQRAALARAVILQPAVVLADEPTGNVDWDMSMRILSLLVELNRMGTGVLIATHDLNLIRSAKSQVTARVLRIADRKIQTAGAEL
jgi:cell division transport system ATP-binding protein